MPIDPPEIPPATPGTPTEPPPGIPPGSPNPEIAPPVREPGAPPRPEELPASFPKKSPCAVQVGRARPILQRMHERLGGRRYTAGDNMELRGTLI